MESPGLRLRRRGSEQHFTEAFQLVDLGQVREIRKMTWLSGDANHSWFVDVFASEDGDDLRRGAGTERCRSLSEVGLARFPAGAPFKARLVKFRYRTDGKPQDIIRFPSELGVYDGVVDEVISLPEVGPVVADGKLSLDVPPHSFAAQGAELRQAARRRRVSAGNLGDGTRPGRAVISPRLQRA